MGSGGVGARHSGPTFSGELAAGMAATQAAKTAAYLPVAAVEGVHVVSEFVCCQPELGFKAEVGGGGSRILRFCRTGAERPGASALLADLQERLQKGEQRLAEIRSELSDLGKEATAKDVAAALTDFPAMLGALAPFERAELVSLLVERVVLNKTKGRLAISFRASGFKSLLSKLV